jgi:hypothetical protein
MRDRPSITERALQLAKQGANLKEIRKVLTREGYEQVFEKTSGVSVRRQLRAAGSRPRTREQRPSEAPEGEH